MIFKKVYNDTPTYVKLYSDNFTALRVCGDVSITYICGDREAMIVVLTEEQANQLTKEQLEQFCEWLIGCIFNHKQNSIIYTEKQLIDWANQPVINATCNFDTVFLQNETNAYS